LNAEDVQVYSEARLLAGIIESLHGRFAVPIAAPNKRAGPQIDDILSEHPGDVRV
jgi:hypothetical protein